MLYKYTSYENGNDCVVLDDRLFYSISSFFAAPGQWSSFRSLRAIF